MVFALDYKPHTHNERLKMKIAVLLSGGVDSSYSAYSYFLHAF